MMHIIMCKKRQNWFATMLTANDKNCKCQIFKPVTCYSSWKDTHMMKVNVVVVGGCPVQLWIKEQGKEKEKRHVFLKL